MHDKAVSKVTKPDLKPDKNNIDNDDNDVTIENKNVENKNNRMNSEKRNKFSNDISKDEITVDNRGSEDHDGLESQSDEQSEGDSDTIEETDCSDGDKIRNADGYVNDSDGSSSDSGESGLDWCKFVYAKQQISHLVVQVYVPAHCNFCRDSKFVKEQTDIKVEVKSVVRIFYAHNTVCETGRVCLHIVF